MIFLPGCKCCCSGCQCGDTFPTQTSNVPELSITTTNGGSFQVCLSAMAADTSVEGAAPQQLRCGPGPDTEFPARKCVYYIVWYDGTCVHRIYFSLANFPECDCDSGDYCDFVIEGWENYSNSCGYSISSIEIVSVGTC